MKPLELTVYPKLERPRRGSDILAYRSQFIDEQLVIQAKRFTDAELAAEKWHAATHATYARARVDACLDNPLPITADKAEDIVGVLHRFATLPHYDEAQP